MPAPHDHDALDASPRLTALPGRSRLVRITEASWAQVTQAVREQQTTLPAEGRTDLLRTGILDAANPAADPIIESHWASVIAAAQASPVRIDLVCVDGDRAWRTAVHVAGRTLLVVDQVCEIGSDEDTVRLGRRSPFVSIGLADISSFSATLEALVPQRTAFLSVTAAPETPAPSPPDEDLPDAPSVAQIQALMTTAALEGAPSLRARSWYALGADGGVLATTTTDDDGEEIAVSAPEGAVAPVMVADLVAAIRQAETAAARTAEAA